MLRWPVQLRIHLSNVRKFDRIAFYLRTVFLDKVLSAFRVYQQAGNAFFAIDRSSLFHQKLRIIFLNAPIDNAENLVVLSHNQRCAALGRNRLDNSITVRRIHTACMLIGGFAIFMIPQVVGSVVVLLELVAVMLRQVWYI